MRLAELIIEDYELNKSQANAVMAVCELAGDDWDFAQTMLEDMGLFVDVFEYV